MYGKLEDFCNAFFYLLIISVYLKQFTLSRTEFYYCCCYLFQWL